LTDHTRTQKSRRRDRDARLFGYINDRINVRNRCTRGAVRTNLQFALRYLFREREHVTLRTWPGAGQPDIEHVDAEIFHQVEELDFCFDGWIARRWLLQTVALCHVI